MKTVFIVLMMVLAVAGAVLTWVPIVIDWRADRKEAQRAADQHRLSESSDQVLGVPSHLEECSGLNGGDQS